MMNKRLAAGALLLLSLSALILFWPEHREAPPPSTGTSALQRLLELKLVDANQKTIDLAAWRGRVRVINFWATWCAPCKEEIPAFSRLQEAHPETRFVGIAIDLADSVRTFSEKHPVSYPLPIGDSQVLALTRELGNPHMSLPFTLVISEEGKALSQKSGRLAESDLAGLLGGGQGTEDRDQGSKEVTGASRRMMASGLLQAHEAPSQ
ncbi:MAG: TlpA family protein disulfide reductase [Zoogloeaceae bacterium]|jgi:thiol-disulfide isomerase/thioredoxin|nr:TlpA family protein disulfide reductase [Zoogloeaceae bacterium]